MCWPTLGLSTGKQARALEAEGIVPHAAAQRAFNNQHDKRLFDRGRFAYAPASDPFTCPSNSEQDDAAQAIAAQGQVPVLAC